MQVQGTAAGVVTPEAVVLEFETASVGSRVLAAVLDLAVQGTALVLLLMALAAFFTQVETAAWVGVALVTVLLFAVLLGYPVALETLWRGRTLGKAALGLRVVTTEGAPVRFRHAAVRSALGLVDLWLFAGMPAVISVLVTRRDQRLGDLAAGTLVLRERSAATPPQARWFPVPVGAEAYVASLDVAVLDAGTALLVRSFLVRAPDLAPAARADLASRLARRVAAELRHTPPPGMPPELFCACVAAAVQARAAPWPGPPAGPPPGAPRPSPPPAAPPPLPGAPPRQAGPGGTPPPGGFEPPA
ncbi:MAG: RDD family protein [Acidimicrobiales bacterium]|nr:RDD family protein [Acidimicrobiales bacterium]